MHPGRGVGYTGSMTDVLKPVFLGPIRIEMPVVLAPLAGYSDLPYRMICRQLGCAYATTEMMLDRLMTAKGRAQSFLMASCPGDTPLAGQMIGNDPAAMAAGAEVLDRMGFDAVDLNFACPVNKALKRKRGGWLTQYPGEVERLTAAVLAATDRPVTVKIRQKCAAGDGDVGLEIARRAFDAGAAAVIAHARSVEAKYAGAADWGFLRALRAQHADRLIMGSGDVLTPAAAVAMRVETGVDVVLAARGAVGNPWFFRQVRDVAAGREPYRPSLAEQRAVIEAHFDLACELYGPLRGPRIMRKHAIKYARMHEHPKALRMAFVAVKTPAQFRQVLEQHYPPAADRAWAPDAPAS